METNVLHWDFVSLPSFQPTAYPERVPEHTATVHHLSCHRFSVRGLFKNCKDSPDTFLRATSSLNLNLSEVLQLGELWGLPAMVQVYNNLVKHTKDANAGKLIGNRNFYNNDYMVSGSINSQKSYSDTLSGSAWSRLCLHVENVLDTDDEHRMCQLTKRSYWQPVRASLASDFSH